jgi:hypothetical protein
MMSRKMFALRATLGAKTKGGLASRPSDTSCVVALIKAKAPTARPRY